MQESIVFLVRVQCRRTESSRSLSHLLMSFLFPISPSKRFGCDANAIAIAMSSSKSIRLCLCLFFMAHVRAVPLPLSPASIHSLYVVDFCVCVLTLCFSTVFLLYFVLANKFDLI